MCKIDYDNKNIIMNSRGVGNCLATAIVLA